MNEHIKISVIVPVYNLQNELERCIKSILIQTHQNLEILVIDDGSTDCSRKIIGKMADSDKRIVPVFKENGGVTSARLAGIEKATGEWIGFVDGDDIIEKDMYELLLENAARYGADISHCGYKMVFPDGRISYFHNSGALITQDRITGLKHLLDGSLIEPGLCNKLYRRTLFPSLLHNSRMDKNLKINEDLLMNYILFASSELSVFQDICKYHYIVREISATRVPINSSKIFDPIQVKRIILELSDQSLLPFAQKAYLSTCINVYHCLMLEKNNTYNHEKEKIRKMILERRKWGVFLGNKQRLSALLICRLPKVYPFIYGIYAKVLLNNPYY